MDELQALFEADAQQLRAKAPSPPPAWRIVQAARANAARRMVGSGMAHRADRSLGDRRWQGTGRCGGGVATVATRAHDRGCAARVAGFTIEATAASRTSRCPARAAR